MKLLRVAAALVAGILLAPTSALAWGFEGHEIVASIARARLTPAVRAKVEALLAADTGTLTGHDMASEATWADAWRGAGHLETAQWHFVDIELDHPDLKTACFGNPSADQPASAGPAQDCVVDKIDEFSTELAAPATSPGERLLALKYLLHFVGDVHQPLHASDHEDRGGNCVRISLGDQRTSNLHSYWDTGVLQPLGSDPQAAAATLNARISPSQAQAWSKGTATDWAQEAFRVAKTAAYTLDTPAGCGQDASPVPLPSSYVSIAQPAANLQLEKAGVRLAWVLNRDLASLSASAIPAAAPAPSAPTLTPSAEGGQQPRTAVSLACSAAADRQGLHGADRKRFREACKRHGGPAN